MRTAIAILWGLCGPALALAADPLVGQKVFLKDNAVVMVDDQVIDEPLPFEAIPVSDVHGDRVMLFAPSSTWTERKYVLPPAEAIAYFSEQVEQNPNSAAAWNKRGIVWMRQKQSGKAIADFGEALRIDPKNADARVQRAFAYYSQAEYEKSLEDGAEVIRIDPQNPGGYNNIAWIRATCPDEQYRDGDLAVRNATTACELTAWSVGSLLDTLGAAYAEKGDFDSAVKWQEKALGLVAGEETESACREHLDLFKAGKPYREDPLAEASANKPAAE